MSVEVINVSKKFGNHVALNGVNVSVRSGELMALLGPSGSGKTTLLRIIGGLEFADEGGRVLLHGEDVTTRGAGERHIGFVFQHYALFRHMTVFDNIAFGMNVRPRRCRPSREQIVEKVRSLLALVQLSGLDHRYPHQLSGGQRQRVALARALAIEPKVLLLDEPFGALDAKVRKELRRWIRRLHNEIHVTSIFVTHDQDEALEVADRVVVMRDAQVEQTGTPNEVYEVPSSPFVYNFLGRVVSLRGDVVNGQLIVGKNAQTLPDRITDGRATIFARPQDIRLAPEANGSLSVEAVVRDVNLAGPVAYLEVERTDDGSILEVEVPIEHSRILQPRSGDLVHVILKDYKVFVDA